MTRQTPDRGLSSMHTLLTDREPDCGDRSGAGLSTGLYRANFDGHFLAVNQVYASILEYDNPEHLIGQVTCIAQEVYQSPTRWGELLSFLQKDEFIRGFESPVVTRRGSMRWLMESVRLVSDEHHGRYILEGIVYDITDRKRMELQHEYDQIKHNRFGLDFWQQVGIHPVKRFH
jgi:PAS domain S-box-containing protein